MPYLPNFLTFTRLGAAPLVLLVFFILDRPFADIISFALFSLAAMTDYIDGHIARRWKQTTALGQMLDPIADKAMVMIALLLLVGLFYFSPWVTIPAAFIILREVIIAGIREHLGQASGQLAVSALAKWKTAVQMLAIGLLLLNGIFQHYFVAATVGMSGQIVNDILAGREQDLVMLSLKYKLMLFSYWAGVILLWLATVLTIVTGWDYMRKSLVLLEGGE